MKSNNAHWYIGRSDLMEEINNILSYMKWAVEKYKNIKEKILFLSTSDVYFYDILYFLSRLMSF